ncbi:MAG: PrgI family protein [Anaerolineae bacterium]
MNHQRHEIPTHLNVEDKAFYGLSVRQVMYLTVGISGAYALWNNWPDLSLGIRVAIAIVCVLAALVLAFVRPYGRGLEEWAFVALRYIAIPKTAIWRPELPPQPKDPDGEGRWAPLTPDVTWQERT